MLKIINPASQIARGHIIEATFLFSFGRIRTPDTAHMLCLLLETSRQNIRCRYVRTGQTFSPGKWDLSERESLCLLLVNALKSNLHLQRKLLNSFKGMPYRAKKFQTNCGH